MVRAPSRLWARAMAAMTAVRSASCRGLERASWLPAWAAGERAWRRLAGGDQRGDLGSRGGEVLHDAGLDLHGVLEAGERVLPAGLRTCEQLLAEVELE